MLVSDHSGRIVMEMAKQGTFWRGEAGYEEARLGHMWNRRVPKRYPDVVVQAQNDQDVIFAPGAATRPQSFGQVWPTQLGRRVPARWRNADRRLSDAHVLR
jgi:hypothetical protein